MDLEGTITLDDLKKENAAEEAGPDDVTLVPEPAEEEVEKEEQPEVIELQLDDDGNEIEPEESEAWMDTGEESGDEPEKKYTDSDAASIRRKYKAREAKANEDMAAKDEENERLKAELERLKAPAQQAITKPDRADFDDEDQYLEALVDYKSNVKGAELQTQHAVEQQRREVAERNQAVSREVDNHYVRAHQLAEKSNISAEAYQSADLKVRQAMDAIFPDTGDEIVDFLISKVGEGSEKVFFNLGVNDKRRQEFLDTFKTDPNGLDAAVYLGQLKAQLTSPVKRVSRAPDPGDEIQGDNSAGANNSSNLKRAYQQAHNTGDTQKAFNTKRKAKAEGVDTSNW